MLCVYCLFHAYGEERIAHSVVCCLLSVVCCLLSVVWCSPARRASRKILERMHEFACLLGFEHRIVEYNMENLRLRALDGTLSLIRSFPSKVAVNKHERCAHTHTHTHPHTPTHT